MDYFSTPLSVPNHPIATMKGFIKNLLVVCLLLGFYSNVSAQNSRLYMADHGLSSSRIRLVYQDLNGFIWVAGENGLDRLIGDHIQNFLHLDEDKQSITNNDITDVFMDANKTLWLGTGKGLNRYVEEKNTFEHVYLSGLERNNRGFSISGILNYPGTENLLVGTSGHGIYVVHSKTGEVDSIQSVRMTRLIGNNFVGDLLIDNRNWLWAFTGDDGFRIIDLKKGSLIKIANIGTFGLEKDQLTCLRLDPKTGNILIGSSTSGFFLYDAHTRLFRKPADPELNSKNIQSILVKRDGTILLGSENRGLWVFDRKTERIQPYLVRNNNLVDLEHSKVHSLMEDNAGNLWMGLYQKGLFIVPKSISGFEYHVVSNDRSGKNTACVSSFAKDGRGNLWIATDGSGIYQAEGSNLTRLQDKNTGLTCHSLIAMVADQNGTVWTGSYGHGLFKSQGDAFAQPANLLELGNNKVMCLEYDKMRNYLYIGTNGSRFDILDLATGRIRHVNAPINKWVRSMHLDRTGRLWVGTSEGTYYYDVDRSQVLNVDIGLAGYYPTNCFEETENQLFIGTSAGLVQYDMKKNRSELVDLGKNLDSYNIMSLAIGMDKSLWLTTPKNLSRLNLKTRHIRTYSSFDGFHIGEFRWGAVYKDRSGYLLFGGDNGIIKVDPMQVNRQRYEVRPIYFTGLTVNNKQVDFNGDPKARNVLDASLTEASKLNLSYKDNSFTLNFSVQEYASPQKVNYSYRLSGYDNTWHHTDASNAKATYASLPPGHYTFEIKGYFNEESHDVSTRSIRVIVANPWYSSILARFFYFLLIVAILYFTYRFYQNKLAQRRRLELAEYSEQVKEDKLRLFTSIAHEIRTPLTLIVSPLKKLMSEVTNNETSEMYNLMYRNSIRILKTINQLLDIRKLDNGQLKLHFTENDLIGTIKGIMLSFKNMATIKQISFTMETSENEPLNVWLDSTHFDKIVYNILSNAFKFTQTAGKILIRIRCLNNNGHLDQPLVNEFVEIRIFNTGKPINENDLSRIFERFYQGHQHTDTSGSGIGLHLTQELVLLHHGHIEAHNIGDEGVEFTVLIPLGNAHLTEEELSPALVETKEQTGDMESEVVSDSDFVDSMTVPKETEEKEPKNKFTIMVVDDDEEFCHYLRKELVEYNILTSNSGNKAWKQILSVHPDVVVTDYRMPDGNGLELCNRIKSNPETDAIPVIILTSENTETIQMQSMQLQADRFLTKPFNILLLKGAIGQALRVREKIKNKINRTEMGYNYEAVAMDSADDKLVKRVIDYIKDHLEDSEMSVEELSREVGFSRVHLNRKLKDILGMSPSNLIKSIRLKQAAYLLVNNNVNISEVAYKVGFSSHSYFSYNFHDFFGMSPKEFVIFYTENPDEESIRKLLE
jgi:signal transduction histidine kinase/ligand-binding sensor domain-containing protein/AraC-like DNA-binding protein/CheY-like chemotaxis protein